MASFDGGLHDRIGRTARGYGRDDRCGGELLSLQEAFVLLDCSLLSPFYQSKTKIHDILTSRELRPAPQLASRHPSRIQTRLHSWRSGSFHDGEGEENSRRLKGMKRKSAVGFGRGNMAFNTGRMGNQAE